MLEILFLGLSGLHCCNPTLHLYLAFWHIIVPTNIKQICERQLLSACSMKEGRKQDYRWTENQISLRSKKESTYLWLYEISTYAGQVLESKITKLGSHLPLGCFQNSFSVISSAAPVASASSSCYPLTFAFKIDWKRGRRRKTGKMKEKH